LDRAGNDRSSPARLLSNGARRTYSHLHGASHEIPSPAPPTISACPTTTSMVVRAGRWDARGTSFRPRPSASTTLPHHHCHMPLRSLRLARVPLRKPIRRDGRCPARRGDLLLVRREQLLRSTAVCRSSCSRSVDPHRAVALCCGLLLPHRFHIEPLERARQRRGSVARSSD
jgi:hypothetical protein